MYVYNNWVVDILGHCDLLGLHATANSLIAARHLTCYGKSPTSCRLVTDLSCRLIEVISDWPGIKRPHSATEANGSRIVKTEVKTDSVMNIHNIKVME